MANFIPSKGDLVILTSDPQSGHEQKGRRPALVVSNRGFNKATEIAIVCPISDTNRRIPFHIQISSNEISGFVMIEQIKSIDFISRKIKKVSKLGSEKLDEVLGILDACIYQDV